MFVATILVLIISIIIVDNAPNKVALSNECKYNKLESGTYKVTIPITKYSFYVDCLTDGTMYINPGQQAVYHYHKINKHNDMMYSIAINQKYYTEADIIDPHTADLIETNEDNEDNLDTISDSNNPDDLSSIDADLTETEKKSVNFTAQYIVYSVIIVMALIFTFGICLLIYWWCCHSKKQLNNNNNSNLNLNNDEKTPFIDIRSQNTINKQKKLIQNKTVYIDNDNNDNNKQYNSINNVYDDIQDNYNDNGFEFEEDGDQLIADYGSTATGTATVTATVATGTGYVIKKISHKNELLQGL